MDYIHALGGAPDALLYLLFGKSHVLRTVGDVLRNGLLKELVLRILEHKPHLEAYATYIHVLAPDVCAVHQHAPGGRLHKPVEMLYQCGLAASGVSDYPDELALAYLQVDAVHRGLFKRSADTVLVSHLVAFQHYRALVVLCGFLRRRYLRAPAFCEAEQSLCALLFADYFRGNVHALLAKLLAQLSHLRDVQPDGAQLLHL